jgi:hypothetical protein
MPKMYFIYKVAGKKSRRAWQIKTRPIYRMETNIKS